MERPCSLLGQRGGTPSSPNATHDLVVVPTRAEILTHDLVVGTKRQGMVTHDLVDAISSSAKLTHKFVDALSSTRSAAHKRVDALSSTQSVTHKLVDALSSTRLATHEVVGQSVCEAFLEVQREGVDATLHADFTFDWDRQIDPPGRVYAEPRRLRMKFTVSCPAAAA